jgi:hypothetical protein
LTFLTPSTPPPITITFFPARFRSTINYNFTADETMLITLFKLFQLKEEIMEKQIENIQKNI